VLDIGADRRGWVEHREIGERPLVVSGALGESVAQWFVGEQPAAPAGTSLSR
jgi:hypothetical protein